MAAWDPYTRAVQALARGQLVVCVPIVNDEGEKTWAVAGFNVLMEDDSDPELVALFLAVETREQLTRRGVLVT